MSHTMLLLFLALLQKTGDGAGLPLKSRHPGPPVPPPPSQLACAGNNASRNGILFLGRCFCEPGWLGHYCDEPLRQHGHCECKPDDYMAFRNFSKELTHPKGYICEALCHWNAEVGCPRTIAGEWKWNQLGKQLHFYQDRLPRKRKNTDLVGRLIEFAEGYEGFRGLNHTHLGHVIEFGCGGYTQLRNIMEHVDVRVDSATLVDPQIKDYQKIARCSFGNGTLLGIMNTTLIASTVEAYGARFGTTSSSASSASSATAVTGGGVVRAWPQYDTVIDMNVLVYAQDAFKFLETLHRSLKVGGLLVFHERWFENHVKSNKCKISGFEVNVIQVRATNHTRAHCPHPTHTSHVFMLLGWQDIVGPLLVPLLAGPVLQHEPDAGPSAAVARLVLHVGQRVVVLGGRSENQGMKRVKGPQASLWCALDTMKLL
jgi:hypothetical protein